MKDCQACDDSARPRQTGDETAAHGIVILGPDDWDLSPCIFCSTSGPPSTRDDNIHFEPHALSGECGKAIRAFLCRSPLDDDRFLLNVPKLTQTPSQCLNARCNRCKVRPGQISYPRDSRGL